MHKYTPLQREFIRKNAPGMGNEDLRLLFNVHFGTNVTREQIKRFKANNKISSGLTGRYPKGHVPANKGMKGTGGWEPTQFKKGNKPFNYKLVGTERVNGDDYVDIKIADPNKWKAKHHIVWEAENGPLPKGHAIIFGDGNRRNFDLNNLICVTRAQLVRLNQNNLIRNDADLTRTGIIVVDLIQKISARKKSKSR